jgi:hypothetical protein
MLSCFMLIYDCVEGIEVCLGSGSVPVYALLCGCMPVDGLRGGWIGEVGRDTLGREVLLGSRRREGRGGG